MCAADPRQGIYLTGTAHYRGIMSAIEVKEWLLCH